MKKCHDLLVLRSDAYQLNSEDVVLEMKSEQHPSLSLNSNYQFIQQLNLLTRDGTPSLLNCSSLEIEGAVRLCGNVVLVGDVKIVNSSDTPKYLPPNKYSNTTIDISSFHTSSPLDVKVVPSTPYLDQKMGTSGLRKPTLTFQQPSYVENFIQATFNALIASGVNILQKPLLVGGDGRFFNDEIIQTIIKIAAGNGKK